jgi:hypothetical protein
MEFLINYPEKMKIQSWKMQDHKIDLCELAMRGKKVEHNPVYFKIISNYF